MNKKKILLSFTATSMIAITGTVLVINGGLKNSSVFATNDVVWYHYAAVEPTPTRHGSKEFWASSSDNCQTFRFDDPGAGSYVERDFFANPYFDDLSKTDDRYIAPTSSSPIINGNTVTYGIYPQTVIMDEELVSNLNNDATEQTNGWFLYRGEYYAKVSAIPYEDNEYNYKFDNGTTIVSGTAYWFKCEPISWTILTNDYVDADGKHLGYYLLSDVLLDACRYDDDYSNNYKDSEIRTWLNNDFYNSAFALGNSYIQTTIVDNSASTTDSDENPYACDNTQDNVFLPSYQDYINSSYGFSAPNNLDDARRCCNATDWTRAMGAYFYDLKYHPYNGAYWTRSPSSEESDVVRSVADFGLVKQWAVGQECVCVRPALSIKIL